MKKLLVILLCLLSLCACATKKTEDDEPVLPEVEVEVGSWLVYQDLPEINDAVFDKARKSWVGMEFSPLQVLGTQVVAGTNIAYLCYGTPVTAEASDPKLKVVVVYEDLEGNAEIQTAEDFNIEKYVDSVGETTPDGLMGGWTDNTELNNMLDAETNAVFDKAMEGLTGVGYEPVCLLATQLVSGTNYAILCKGTTVTAEPRTHLYVVTVYEDLQGNAELLNICGIDLSSFVQL